MDEKIEETCANTVIHKSQAELTYGRWDFVLFGSSKSDPEVSTVRVCVAEQAMIERSSLYMASLGDPYQIGHNGIMPIEEIAGEDLNDELRGLEIYGISPLRPISILEKFDSAGLSKTRDMVMEKYGESNIAIIETPEESMWSISALYYLDRCDQLMPDPFMTAIRSTMRDTSIDFSTPRGNNSNRLN